MNYEGDRLKLGLAEKFVWHVGQQPTFALRLEVLCLQREFDDKVCKKTVEILLFLSVLPQLLISVTNLPLSVQFVNCLLRRSSEKRIVKKVFVLRVTRWKLFKFGKHLIKTYLLLVG